MSLSARRWLLLVIAGAPLALFEACSFPDVEFGSGDTATEAGGPTEAESQLPPDEGSNPPRPHPPDVDPDGGSAEAAVRDSAPLERPDAEAGVVGCAGAGGQPCDCDDDKALNGGPGCIPPDDEKIDCDDFDPLVDPKAGFVAAAWDPRSPHVPANDWNCDGTVTKQFDYGIQCSLSDCTQGFAQDIPCGATGTYNICKGTVNVLGLLTLCSVGTTEERVQGCR
jgi:hypothetical protein